MKKNYAKKSGIFLINSNTRIILAYNLVIVILTFVFYPLIPMLLNYPPNNEQVSAALGTKNVLQFVIVCVYACIVGTIFLVRALSKFKNWEMLDRSDEKDILKIREIRKGAINLPFTIFILQIIQVNVPLIFVGLIVTSLNNSSKVAVFKVILMTLSLFFLAGVFAYIFSKSIFKEILLKTYAGDSEEGRRLSLRKSIFIQIIPMFLVAILFTALIGYSRVITEKGNMMYGIYKNLLVEKFQNAENISSVDKAFEKLKEISFDDSISFYFVKDPDGNIVTSDGSIMGGYFNYYIENPYEGDRLFDINAENQGVLLSYSTNEGEWKIGLIFKVASDNTIKIFIVGFIALLLLNILVLYYVVSSLSKDISIVVENLTEISDRDNVDLDKKLPVTSNDEIGDLVVAFNKIQEREKAHIKEIEEQQAIMVERERLASLGQLIGGIAHNMRTPIMSISGAIEGLKGLVGEYRESIGDCTVTPEDHYEIAQEMTEWLNKMGPYCSYMSDILTAVKEQTVQHINEEYLEFNLDELIKRVELLMNNELKQNCSILKIDCHADRSTRIPGDISILVQVFNNLITNAIQSYDGMGNEIVFEIQKKGKWIEFSVKDNGSGIPEVIKKKLFKEMVTTKGKKGTGLGLFISYSNIKARFRGNMWFESTKGIGTAFYVSIPLGQIVNPG